MTAIPTYRSGSTSVTADGAAADPEERAAALEFLPRLAARVLQTANSAAFNPGGKPVTELRSAITRVGQHMLQGITVAYAIQQMKDEESLRTIGQPLLAWGFPEALCDAVAEQHDFERKRKHDATLTDVLIVSRILAEALSTAEPREVAMDGIDAFASIGLNATDCQATLVRAERRIAVVHAALM